MADTAGNADLYAVERLSDTPIGSLCASSLTTLLFTASGNPASAAAYRFSHCSHP